MPEQTKGKRNIRKKKVVSSSRFSNIVKPKDMSLLGWQVALRQQAATCLP